MFEVGRVRSSDQPRHQLHVVGSFWKTRELATEFAVDIDPRPVGWLVANSEIKVMHLDFSETAEHDFGHRP